MNMRSKRMNQKFDDHKESLRKKAEERVKKHPPRIEELTTAQIRNLIHDYHVHQIELEIQNEELRSTHENLQKTRDRFAKLFNQAPVGYLQIDQNGIIRHSNQTFADMVGWKAEHISGKAFVDFIFSQDRHTFHGRYRAFYKNPQGKELELRLKSSNNVLTVRCTGRREFNEHAKSGKDDTQDLLLAANDISEQVQSRKDLIESEERFRKLIENMAEGIVLKDASDRYVHWNQAASDIFGLELDHLKGRTTESFTRKIIREDGSDFPAHELPSQHTRLTGEPCRNVILGIVRGPEDVVWVKASSIPLFKPENDHLDSVIISFSDITERRKMEQELDSTRMELSTILDTVPVMIWRKDIHGRYIHANKFFCDSVGIEIKALKGRNDFEVHPREIAQKYTEDDQKVISDAKPMRAIAEQFRQSTGKTGWSFTEKMPYYDSHGNITGTIGFALDITDLKRVEEKFKQANQQLQNTLSEQDMFFSIIAHDLKSPMSGILSLSKMLYQDLDEMSGQDLRLSVREMYKSAEGVFALLQNLLEWSRLRRENIDFSPEKFPLRELARSCLKTAANIARQKDIALDNAISPELEAVVDQSMINTVFRNLVFNAIKFTYPGGKVRVSARKTGSNIEVCVEDNGSGMDREIMDHLFYVDKRKKQLGTDGEKGTGLGLILCKEFIEKHGGKIRVESEPGQGTEVFFTLPAA